MVQLVLWPTTGALDMNFGTSKEDEQFGCGDDAGYGNDYQQSKRRAMFEGQQPCAPVNSGRYRKDL